MDPDKIVRPGLFEDVLTKQLVDGCIILPESPFVYRVSREVVKEGPQCPVAEALIVVFDLGRG